MFGLYCADPALGIALGESLEFYGLEPNPFATNRRPRPARTFGEQMRRLDLGGKVLARVRQRVPVGPDDRRLIERLVDSACELIENPEQPAPDRNTGASVAAVVAYVAAGGGAIGPFDSFARRFVSSAELLEPVVDRQDVRPAPTTTNPTRRPTGPDRPSSPTKTNPTRAIRSSRWTGKGVRS
jgi:hypothetical protein